MEGERRSLSQSDVPTGAGGQGGGRKGTARRLSLRCSDANSPRTPGDSNKEGQEDV